MKRATKINIALLALTLSASGLYAQQGFGTATPNKASVIDMTSNTKGLLIPRVALTNTTVFAPISGATSSATNSLLVYNTATAGTAPNNVVPGYYYWSQPTAAAGSWIRLASASDVKTTTLSNGTNTTVGSTVTGNVTNYQVNVALANGTTLGVVKQAETNPSVNIDANGVLSVNLANATGKGNLTATTGDGSITVNNGTNATLTNTDIKVSDLGITAGKIANNAVTAAKINADIAGNGLTQATGGALQVNANNGLNVDTSADAVQLGGNLTRNTTITNNGNTFTIATNGTATSVTGLPTVGAMSVNDKIVITDVNGVLKQAKSVMPTFFYAPSIALPTAPDQISTSISGIAQSGGVYTVQLHTIYTNQFGGTFTTGTSNSGRVANNTRNTALPAFTASQLDYYVTYFDTTVFSDVTISDAGIMTYKIKADADVTVGSFMNIVFAVKP